MKIKLNFNVLSFFVAAAMIFNTAPAVLAENTDSSAANGEIYTVESDKNSYAYYLNTQKDLTDGAHSDVMIAQGNAVMKSGSQAAYKVNVPEAGNYTLMLTYKALKTQDIVLEFEVDGAVPFSEAQRITFPVFWENGSKERVDGKGNQFAPEQVVYGGSVTVEARDYSGKYEYAYLFSLKGGEHNIGINVVQGEFELNEIKLTAPDTVPKYKKPDVNSETVKNVSIIEGESAKLKNNRSIIPLCDNATPLVYPNDPVKNQLNYIGGSNWSKPGKSIEWSFEVEKTGYYSIEFLYRQNQVLNGVSYRSLLIDGKSPFEEAQRIKFKYGRGWQSEFFGDGDEKYLIYLEKGEHTLSLVSTIGPLSDIYVSMQDIVAEMGNLYREITMVIGETVDINRSYELFNQIPGFNNRLSSLSMSLKDIADRIEALQEMDSGSNVSLIDNAVRVIDLMIESPYSAHRYKSSFYDAYVNINSIMSSMSDMPLDIDRIVIAGESAEYVSEKPSFIKRFMFSVKRFFVTFTGDYKLLSDNKSNGSLKIWVNWGRDQAQVLNSLIQESFVTEEKIDVNVSIVNASLIQGILSGDGPDVLLQMTRTDPVNYAMRGALVDLSRFDDIEEIKARFTDSAIIPYEYGNGVYALPDTQSFFMMFVRTDILESLGISLPRTWDEFTEAAILLQRKNLQVSLPYTQIFDSGTVNVGVGGLTIYPTLLSQKGLSLYNKEQTACTLTETEQIKVFNDWMNWHTKYRIPVVMDFYNRFKTGSAPIGIAPYTLYTQIKAAAPEIDGRWTVFELPGTEDENGKINNVSAGSGTGCAITKLSKNPENAWKFLKWWTSDEIQLKYSNNLESLLGSLGRVSVSNTKAFESMDWDIDMKESMIRQRDNICEIPEIPGGYYTARCIDQAFWGVYEQGNVPLDMITKWGAVANTEITRKRAEYNDE